MDFQEKMKREKGQMKTRLWHWGQAVDRCLWKEEELQKQKVFYDLQRRIWAGDRSTRGKQTWQKMEQEYAEGLQRAQEELQEIIREKTKMDWMIGRLEGEEETFIRLRFGKGYGFDYIALKMHLSRATLFRLQDRALEKLLQMDIETL